MCIRDSRTTDRVPKRRILMEVTVAIDCMGGDHGVRVTVPLSLIHISEPTRPY